MGQHTGASAAELQVPPALPQLKCFLKGPTGWSVVPDQPGLTSGLVTAVTVLNYTPAGVAASPGAGTALPLGPAPLTMFKGRYQWLPPPLGYAQGQCMVLPESNAAETVAGSTMFIGNTTAEGCCAACAAQQDCDVWVYCPEAKGEHALHTAASNQAAATLVVASCSLWHTPYLCSICMRSAILLPLHAGARMATGRRTTALHAACAVRASLQAASQVGAEQQQGTDGFVQVKLDLWVCAAGR